MPELAAYITQQNCVRGFPPAEHAGRSSLDSWELQHCGLGTSGLSAGTTDQGCIRILSFDAQGQAAGTSNGVVELHDGEPRHLCSNAPMPQTPTLYMRLQAYQLATLSFGLARLEPQQYWCVQSCASKASVGWQISLSVLCSRSAGRQGLDANESLAPDVVLDPQVFDIRSPEASWKIFS